MDITQGFKILNKVKEVLGELDDVDEKIKTTTSLIKFSKNTSAFEDDEKEYSENIIKELVSDIEEYKKEKTDLKHELLIFINIFMSTMDFELNDNQKALIKVKEDREASDHLKFLRFAQINTDFIKYQNEYSNTICSLRSDNNILRDENRQLIKEIKESGVANKSEIEVVVIHDDTKEE